MPDTHVAPMLEKHTIGFVPESDRHGKVRDLFTLWFGGNIAPLPDRDRRARRPVCST